VNVNDHPTKEKVVATATAYFAEVRPHIVERIGESNSVIAHDSEWQTIVRLAQGNNARGSYLKILSRVRKQLAEFNVAILSIAASSKPATGSLSANQSREEEILVQTLEKLIPTAATSYRQGLLDLKAADRLSYRGTAAEFREALREVLAHRTR